MMRADTGQNEGVWKEGKNERKTDRERKNERKTEKEEKRKKERNEVFNQKNQKFSMGLFITLRTTPPHYYVCAQYDGAWS